MAVIDAPRASHHAATDEVLRPLRGRVRGVDLARAVAIVGMFAVHVGPIDGSGLTERLYALPHGRASLLFALVAGAGVSLLARVRRTRLGEVRRTLVWRAALLLPAGLALQLLDHGVNVILHTYAALFLVALAALTVPDRWLLAGVAASATLGPLVFLRGATVAPSVFDRSDAAWGDPAGEVLHRLVLSGPYPLVTWAAPLLLGMWLGRRDLADRRVQARLVVIGGVVAVACVVVAEVAQVAFPHPDDPTGWGQLALATPHGQTPLWLVGGIASACAILGGALWAAERAWRATAPVVALGQLALTAYVLHLVGLHLAPEALTPDEVGPAVLVVVVATAILALLATAWRAGLGSGPLERLLRPPLAPRWRAVHGR